MPYFVYIIKSKKDGTFHKRFTENYLERINAHNTGDSNYTKNKMPWDLIYVEELPDKTSALSREKFQILIPTINTSSTCSNPAFHWSKVSFNTNF